MAGRRHDHRVLARDLVGEGRHPEMVLHPRDDVEIGQAGLDHHHVGALLEIEPDLGDRLVGIARVHLVGALVADQRRVGADRVAERAIEGRRVFRRIGHDLHVLLARRVERGPDRADAPVHHVGGGDHVGPGIGQRQRLLDEDRHAGVVEDALALHHAVMAMRGVGVERRVADDADLRHLGLDRPHRPAHQVARVDRLGASRVAQRLVDEGEGRDRRNAERSRMRGLAHGLVDVQAVDARHPGDGCAGLARIHQEERPDQIVGRQPRFAHQPP